MRKPLKKPVILPLPPGAPPFKLIAPPEVIDVLATWVIRALAKEAKATAKEREAAAEQAA